nr:urease accessory UreF family protein [Brucella sp. NBRC 12950]
MASLSAAAPVLHLLRLVSPNQPVGGFSYSRGLEWAVQSGSITDERTCSSWVLGLLEHCYAALDGAIFWRMMLALRAADMSEFARLNEWLGASRESKELELEDRRMAESLLSLLDDLGVQGINEDLRKGRPTYPAAFAKAAAHWEIPPYSALYGLMWSVVESQITAAIRLVPLGHTAGQRILIGAVDRIEQAARKSTLLKETQIGNTAPAMAMASAWHETQYSRLFRS